MGAGAGAGAAAAAAAQVWGGGGGEPRPRPALAPAAGGSSEGLRGPHGGEEGPLAAWHARGSAYPAAPVPAGSRARGLL